MEKSSSPGGVRRISLPLKIAGISCVLLLAAILVLSILNVQSMREASLQSAILMGRNKLVGDISSFQHTIEHDHGQLSMKDGKLVDGDDQPVQYDYTIVDEIASLLGVHATIFMKEGDDFRRITTSIIDQGGNRAVDTFLGKNSSAYKPIVSGADYFGKAVILGKDYLTAYRPYFADNSNEVIGILFIGIEMSSINDYITDITNSTIKSVFYHAVIILILAVLITVAVCRIILLKPILAVMAMLKSIRKGDFDSKLLINSRDEIGEMASHINYTVEKVKEMVAALEHSGHLLETANKATAILLSNNDINNFETSLLKCFMLIGQHLDVDRVQLWRNETIEDEPGFVLRHEWRSDYGKNCISIPLNKSFLYSEKKEWDKKFRHHEHINSPIGKLPEEDRAFFKFYDIKSLVVIPIFLDGVFWGFFSINDCRHERVFTEEEINILSSTGLMLSSAVNRNIQSLITREADERVQIMFNSAPFGASFWDEYLNIVDCNDELVRLFDLSDKQEFIDRFFELSPEKQPDGSDSKEAAIKYLKEAIAKDYSRYEWVHQKLNGEQLPCEVIFVRVKHREKFTLTAYIRDLREQKAIMAANEKISEANERIQTIFEATPLAITMWDPNTYALLDCNMEAVRLVGLNDKETYKQKFAEMSPEYQSDGQKTADKFIGIFDIVLNKGSCHHNWEQCSITGEVIPFRVNTVRLKHMGAYIVISYALDMRETNAAIAKMREANDYIQSILDAAPLAITVWNPANYELLNCNLQAIHMVGLTDKKTYMETFAEMATEYQANGRKSSDMLVEIFDEAMKNGICRHDWTHKTIDGEVIPFRVNAVRLKYMDDNIIISYALDMREINAAIAKQRKTDEFTQLMFKSMPLACQLWNMDLQCVMCNDEALRLYIVNDKNQFLENFFDYSPPCQPDGRPSKEKGEEQIKKGFEEGYHRFEWVHRRGNGEDFPCEIIMSRTMFNGEPVLLTYTNDLSEQMEIIKERQKAEVAEESNKAKSDFLARMSHEIRTPMNAILGIAEIQLQEDNHPLLTKEAFERIYNSGSLLLGIINDILDLSKIEAGKLELVLAQYDISSLIHDTVQINIMRYEAKSIEFVLNVDENLPILLYGDELRIKQILSNLLSNAFKYTEKGTIKLTANAETDVDGDPKKVNLIFTISDTGQGMTPEQVKKLGTEYSRFNMEANRKTEGTGLGMNITRNLIQLMCGTISIESESGVGSTFKIILPQESAGSAVIGKEVADNLMKLNLDNSVKLRSFQLKKEFMPYGRVLIVDDVETNLFVARGLLAPYGLTLETAISGFEAIDKIKDNMVYDIIFMDHMMPRMDGIEATKTIRELGYTKPIVALTANAIAGQAEVFIENGFDDFISKPIDIRQLNMILNKLIRDKYPSEVVEAARKQKAQLTSGKSEDSNLDPYLAEIFERDAKKIIAELEDVFLNKCSRKDDISTFIIEIHAIKSALFNIGEAELASDASKLEQSAREKNIRLILAELPSFLGKLHSLIDKLEPHKHSSSKTINSDDKQYLDEKLLSIKNACTLLNKRVAKDILSELKRKTWSQPIEDQLEKISVHLLHSEFEEVVKEIESSLHSL